MKRNQPPLELRPLGPLQLAALVSYVTAMVFHLVGYTTDDWSSLYVGGVYWRAGLWRGCAWNQTGDGAWHCSTQLFSDKVFRTGLNSDWDIGCQVLMSLSLVALFLLVFVLSAFICFKRFYSHRNSLLLTIGLLIATSGVCHMITLIMYGKEVAKIPESNVRASFIIIIFSLLLEILIIILLALDRQTNCSVNSARNTRRIIWRKPKQKRSLPSDKNVMCSIEENVSPKHSYSQYLHGSRTASVSSLSEVETFKKFASTDLSALSGYESGISGSLAGPLHSIGSASSLHTRSTGVTMLNDRSSIESAV